MLKLMKKIFTSQCSKWLAIRTFIMVFLSNLAPVLALLVFKGLVLTEYDLLVSPTVLNGVFKYICPVSGRIKK